MRKFNLLLLIVLCSNTDNGVAQNKPVQQAAPQSQFPVQQETVHSPRPIQQTIPMRVQVLTATTFKDIQTGAAYKLYGVDACELQQTAILTHQVWPCGVVATAWLVNATLNKWVACTTIRQDNNVRIARCSTGEFPDIASEMLKAGLAVTLPNQEDKAIKSYAEIEIAAKTSYKGVWGSQFQLPWAYRANPDAAPAPESFPPRITTQD